MAQLVKTDDKTLTCKPGRLTIRGDRIGRFFNEFFNEFFDEVYQPFDFAGFEDRFNGWTETDKSYTIETDLPGIKKEDLKINIKGNVVEISAQSKRQRRESNYFNKFTIPEAADFEKVTSKLEDGILTITFPKTEKVKGREVKVE